jgi:hypothetical protein
MELELAPMESKSGEQSEQLQGRMRDRKHQHGPARQPGPRAVRIRRRRSRADRDQYCTHHRARARASKGPLASWERSPTLHSRRLPVRQQRTPR